MENLELLIIELTEIQLRNGLTDSGKDYLKGLIKAKELLSSK